MRISDMRIPGTGARRGTTATVAAVVGFAALVGACGLPVDEEAVLLPQDDHLELLDGTTSTVAPVAEPGDSDSTPVELFFIGTDRKLETVIRMFPDDATKNDVLIALEAGPTPEEVAEYEGVDILQTFLPAGLSARFGTLNEEFGSQPIIVDPAAELRQRVEEQTDNGRLIVRQIVCTVLTLKLADVSGVEIYDGEEPIPLTDNAAQPIIGPAELEDFDNCITGAEELQDQLETEAEADPEADAEGDADGGAEGAAEDGAAGPVDADSPLSASGSG